MMQWKVTKGNVSDLSPFLSYFEGVTDEALHDDYAAL
jgi:hypothetical protein